MPRYQRIPPPRPVPWGHTLRLWLALATLGAVLMVAVLWTERLPPPAPANAPAGEFSAARALPAIAELADSAGLRLPGSAGSARAREYLLGRLRSVPGSEVVVQDTVGVARVGEVVVAFRVRNVLARIHGAADASSSSASASSASASSASASSASASSASASATGADALLLAAHYDSPASGVGAADDATAVAVLLETARAVGAGPRPAGTILLAIGDAEEQGLLGARAFLLHPWAREVRAFVNLESAGNAGRAALFQATPGSTALLRAYARAAPHAHGTVLGQDIFQAGLIPSGTDFEVYTREGGLQGLDIALYRGGWAYHTLLDRAAAIHPGSVQQLGSNVLAIARSPAAAHSPPAQAPAGPRAGRSDADAPADLQPAPIYHDVPLYGLVTYSRTTAVVFSMAAGVLLLAGIAILLRQGRLRGRALAAAIATSAAGMAVAMAAALMVAALVAIVGRHPHAWFAHPWRGVAAYGGAAFTVLLAAQWRLANRRAARTEPPEERMLAAWVAAFVLLLAVLAILMAAGAGSAYLALWWVASGATSLWVLATRHRGRWLTGAVIGLAPGALLTLHAGYLAVELFVPIAGRAGGGIPFDLVLAGLVAVVAILLLPPFTALLHRGGRPGAAAVISAFVTVVAIATLWFTEPFTADRPQRLVLLHEGDGGAGWLSLSSLDALGPWRAGAGLGAANPDREPRGAARMRFDAPSPPVLPPRLHLLGERVAHDGRGRIVELRLVDRAAYSVYVSIVGGRAARWDIDGAVSDSAAATPASRARFVASPDSGWTFRLHLPDSGPVELELQARHAVLTPTARTAIASLPAWTTVHTEAVVRSRAVF